MADEKKKKELEDSKRLADPKGGRTDDTANADTPTNEPPHPPGATHDPKAPKPPEG